MPGRSVLTIMGVTAKVNSQGISEAAWKGTRERGRETRQKIGPRQPTGCAEIKFVGQHFNGANLISRSNDRPSLTFQGLDASASGLFLSRQTEMRFALRLLFHKVVEPIICIAACILLAYGASWLFTPGN